MVGHFVIGEGGSAERYVTPEMISMYNINYNFYCSEMFI